jgi:nitroreductase
MPKAYIIMLVDNKIARTPNHDAGIAAMSISIVAYDGGLGSCILASVNRKKLGDILNVPEGLAIALVVTLGYPAENPIVETVKNRDIKYWFDENGVLHVPKRDIKDIVRWNNCPF